MARPVGDSLRIYYRDMVIVRKACRKELEVYGVGKAGRDLYN